MALTSIPDDVARAIVMSLSLWDARSLQKAHPHFCSVVNACVGECVQKALRSLPPKMLSTMLSLKCLEQDGSNRRSNGGLRWSRNPHANTISLRYGTTATNLEVQGDRNGGLIASISLTTHTATTRPTFETLETMLSALWWFCQASLNLTKLQLLTIRCSSPTHRPTCETLNCIAQQFVTCHVLSLVNDSFCIQDHGEVIMIKRV